MTQSKEPDSPKVEELVESLTASLRISSDSTDETQREHAALLDLVDELRSHDLTNSTDISLPQMIVCGDQSSGKSSVLEAITGIKIPVADKVCTRFATEITLRLSDTRSIHISINPGANRTPKQKETLRNFRALIPSPEKFAEVVTSAHKAMMDASGDLKPRFFDDVLRIELHGPNQPQLTFVDLPGLIHSTKVAQHAEDITFVKNLVESYMKSERSVIMAVFQADSNIEKQQILSLFEKHDPNHDRTIGIITRPDRLPEVSDEKDTYVKLARNEEIVLKHRWHLLRNRDVSEIDWSTEQRDRKEKEFFSKGVWVKVSPADKGIETLRTKLSSILLRQIRQELPGVFKEIRSEYEKCQSQLKEIGEARVTVEQQRQYLNRVAGRYNSLIRDATMGHYNLDPFFQDANGDAMSKMPVKLRALLQNRNRQFSDVMHNKGKTCGDSTVAEADNALDAQIEPPLPTAGYNPLHDEVTKILKFNKGHELPISSYQATDVATLFQWQSRKWKDIATKHILLVWKDVQTFLDHLISHITDETTYAALMVNSFDDKMAGLRNNLLDKLDELIKPYRSELMCYNPNFSTVYKAQLQYEIRVDLDKSLQSRGGPIGFAAELDRIAKTKPTAQLTEDKIANDCFTLLWGLLDKSEWNIAHHETSIRMLYTMSTYYEIAIVNFVDNVASLCIEQCLVEQLEDLFSSEIVYGMDEASIRRLAGESPETMKQRERIEEKMQTLEKALKSIRGQLGRDLNGLLRARS